MKKNDKIKLFFFFGMFFVLIIISIIHKTYSISDISDEYISNNIDKLNVILEKNYDKTSKFALKKILDENGRVPAYSYYSHIKSRGIRELKAYDGKIFMGLGDWNDNTGPVKILYYDTLSGKVVTSGTISDEAVEKFTIINNKLYTTGADPRSNWGYGSYYVYDNDSNSWVRHQFNDGWIHVFDVEEYNGKIFMSGSTTAGMSRMPIQVSYDNGVTFNDVPIYRDGEVLPFNSNLRFYAFIKFDGKLYSFTYWEKNGTLYVYDEEKNEFNFVSDIPREKSEYGVYESYRYNIIHFKNNNVFNNNFLYVTGGKNLYKSSNMVDFEIVPITTTDVVQDLAVNGDTLYTLSYQYNSDKTFSTRIYSTKDLETFDLVYEFNIDTLPFTIEYYEDNIYIGTIWDENSKDYYDYTNGIKTAANSETGTLYQINLNKLETYLSIDKQEKNINITKDGVSYPVSYELNSDNSIYSTILKFNNSMTKKEWELEFSKLENLKLIYTLDDTKKYVNLEESSAYFDSVVSEYIEMSSKEYVNAIEFASDMFGQDLNVEDVRFNLVSENIGVSENEYEVLVTLTVYNIDDNITSDKYVINEEEKYIYVGRDIDYEIIKSNINKSNLINLEIDQNSNILHVKYNDNILKEYKLVIFNMNKKVIDKYIYVCNLKDNEILSEFDVINGNLKIDNNKLQIIYNEIILNEYELIRLVSDDFLYINDEKVYISNNKIDDIKVNIQCINAEVFINDDNMLIIRNDMVVAMHDILSIDFGLLREMNNEILVPEDLLYEEFINNINVTSGITYKIFNDLQEVADGIITENMILKLYYDEKEIDIFSIKNEYLVFDTSIVVDSENSYLSNIDSNTKVSDIVNKITTSGIVTITNNKGEILEDNNLIGTGSKITIKLTREIFEYQVIVNGDLDGDGLICLQDIFKIANYVYNDKTSLDGVYIKAADYDNNNVYNLQDIMKTAKRYTKEVIK